MDIKNIKFWNYQKNKILWSKKPKKILKKRSNGFFWFNDGKLNVAENCIKKNLDKNLGKKNAIHYIKQNGNEFSITYDELNKLVNNFSIYLKKINKNSKPIFIHSSASIESSVFMLSAAKLGIKHCVIFEELENEAISKRLNLIKPGIVITKTSDKNKIVFFKKKQKEFKYKLIIINETKDFLKRYNTPCKRLNSYKKNNSNDELFTLFTSGSTGTPKGIIHSTGGYLLYAKLTCMKQFGITQNKTILCASDAGWINGHTYALYGPLSIGATTVLLEKPTIVLNVKRLKNILIKYKVNILYLPVTLVRMLKNIKYNLKVSSKYLGTLGSMGEPLATSVAKWFAKSFNLKKKAIVNTYFQTETGGIVFSPTFKEDSSTFGTVGKSFCNKIDLNIKKKDNKKEDLKIKTPWPGCMINVENENFVWKKYWDKNNFFNLFDVGKYDAKNRLLILGRNDDVINIRGHRIGTGEIESTILQINEVIEACAIPVSDKLEGHRICLFLVCKKDRKKNVEDKINSKLIENFGTFAIPKQTYFVSSLPKTRSGKIIRRVIRDIVENKSGKKNLGDLSTLLDKKSVLEIIKLLKKDIN
jgi:acetyl-CoA synthetase